MPRNLQPGRPSFKALGTFRALVEPGEAGLKTACRSLMWHPVLSSPLTSESVHKSSPTDARIQILGGNRSAATVPTPVSPWLLGLLSLLFSLRNPVRVIGWLDATASSTVTQCNSIKGFPSLVLRQDLRAGLHYILGICGVVKLLRSRFVCVQSYEVTGP